MNRLFITCIFFLLSCSSNKANKKEAEIIHSNSSSILSDTCIDFNSLNNKIRDGLISKSEALKELKNLLPHLKNYFYKNNGKDINKLNWVFPVEGYTSTAIGGTNGSGYIASGYDYFDGNKHAGHPAHDIFIIDKNQDCIDDKSKKEVNVLSMTEGIVIATQNTWDTTSNLRGGKYIWIYTPSINIFFYYAHNSKILVGVCDIIKPGDVIATIGRTGLNAFKKRSPTHLHIMQLKIDDNFYPKSVDCYNELTSVKPLR